MFDYASQAQVFPSCPLCGGVEFESLAVNDRYNMKIKTVGCRGCGLVQTRPRLSPVAFSTFYQNHYRTYYQAVDLPDESYINFFHKGERLTYTAKLVASNVELRPGMRVLDVGCAEGTLFSNLKLHCCNELVFVGIEPSKSYAAYAEKATGCTIYPTFEGLLCSKETGFDLIVVNHVLEHVDDPVVFLSRLRELLTPGGNLFVDVPDISRYTSPRDLHIAHVFHFSQSTLNAVVQKSGFGVVASMQHVPPHHPESIWCLAKKSEPELTSPLKILDAEMVFWGRIKHINKKMPFYLLEVSLRRTRVISFFVKPLKFCAAFLKKPAERT